MTVHDAAHAYDRKRNGLDPIGILTGIGSVEILVVQGDRLLDDTLTHILHPDVQRHLLA